MTDPTRYVEPLDPRTRECGNDLHLTCRCHGTGRVALHPTPTVEVCIDPGGSGSWCWYDSDGHGSDYQYPTPALAFRAARLAWLGAELMPLRSGGRFGVFASDGAQLATGPTPEAAIEAAFAAREGA